MSLTGPAGEDESLGKRRLKLALLALLAVSRRALPREVLVDTFWGDQDEEHARHSLSDALSHLRRVLGTRAIATRAADIQLDPKAGLDVDAIELTAAAAAGNHARVVDLYGGPFLDGVHVDRSPRFEDWVTRERERLRQLFLTSAPLAGEMLVERGDVAGALAVAERWLDADPESPVVPGLVSAYRARLADSAPTGARADSHPLRRRWPLALAVTGALLTIGVIFALEHRAAPPHPTRPTVAVMALRNIRGDSADAWLEDGLQQMLIADLSRASALEVIDPSLLRDAVQRRGVAREAELTTPAAVDLGKRLGATWVVTGGVTHGEGAYVVDITVRQASDGAPLQVYSVVGSDVITVADRVAARILAATDAHAQGPRLADVETGNLEAYQHYIRALQAAQEGRPNDITRELDAAISLDSGFVSALVERIRDAASSGDTATVGRMALLLQRAGSRVTEWDHLELAVYAAQHNGEHERAEALARQLVTSYARDPRGYEALADVLGNAGKWIAADSVLERLLALDSLATAAGSGPCVPCSAYGGLVQLRIVAGDLAGAERAARQWIALQPGLPGPWRDLGAVLTFGGHYAPALAATERAVALSGGDVGFTLRLGAVRLLARDYAGADSLVRLWIRSSVPDLRGGALDLEAMMDRERGQFRASNAVFARLIAHDSASRSMELVIANSMARLGHRAEAAAEYGRLDRERAGQDRAAASRVSPVQPLTGDVARAFSWLHALEADALGAPWPGETSPVGDTVRLRMLADSIAEVSTRSYYGRDWHLANHVRGLIAMAGGHYADAARELQSARWGAAGWTATDEALAQAYLALGRTDSAIAVLRGGYEGPLDAMGRYVPRTDLDYLMALAFARAGTRDSAAIYAAYVRRAWAHADPEVQRRLAGLPRLN